jgi:LmbE family N-acetylglucosaminyl deacetylase
MLSTTTSSIGQARQNETSWTTRHRYTTPSEDDVIWASLAFAQPDGATLARRAEHLSVAGSVLYVAAHPDDENTRLLAWLHGERGLHVTYLSLTRGGGGQNLLGDHMAELLGVVRTGELLAARGIDGAQQRFTRARDFGYARSAEESLAVWGHDPILHDVVRVIREVRPDVVITRFGPHDDTHGHHVASALLAAEAAERAADPAYVTEGLGPWTVDRVLRNESHWRITDETDTSAWHTLDVGTYDPARGVSWGEVAAASRTMHKSQGFGSAPTVGPQLEYFSGVAGAVPPVDDDILAGLDLSWDRFPGTGRLQRALRRLEVDPLDPAASLDALADVHEALTTVPDRTWRRRMVERVEQLMVDASGLYVRADASVPEVAPGGAVDVELTVVPRAAPIDVRGVRSSPAVDVPSPGAMERGARWSGTFSLSIPEDAPHTRPHWLTSPPEAHRYVVPEGPARTAADVRSTPTVELDLLVAGRPLTIRRPIQFARTDRIRGEVTHPLEILPPTTARFDRRARLVPANTTLQVPVHVHGPPGSGTLTVAGVDQPFTLTTERTSASLGFPVDVGTDPVVLEAHIDGTPALTADVLDYDHLDRRTVLRDAALRIVPVSLDRGAVTHVGYVRGSGDQVGQALQDLGYTVHTLPPAPRPEALEDLDAVVLGIRALNTHPDLLRDGVLLDWVHEGGRLLVQYNTSTSRRPLDGRLPDALVIRRGRVTDETAPVRVLSPDEPVLAGPNRITAADWDGWVQERGLYFGASWGPSWRPVLSLHDPDRPAETGALLIRSHGEGVVVYTGLSLFRQLPAGVPGAARLLANLLAADPEGP